jgi:hypothetical protein
VTSFVSYFDLKTLGRGVSLRWGIRTKGWPQPFGLEGIEAIVLRTDLTLRKEILWESETMTNGY